MPNCCLCAEFDELERAYAPTEFAAEPYTERAAAADREQNELGEAQLALAERIHEIAATTLAGHAARARCLARWAPDLLECHDDIETFLQSAILRDLTGFPVEPAPVIDSSPVELPEQVNPDAELVRICQEHAVNLQAYNAQTEIREDRRSDPLWIAYEETCDAIGDAEPQTIAGMIATARAAKVEAFNPHKGEYQPESSFAETWGWDLINDLLRLYGSAA